MLNAIKFYYDITLLIEAIYSNPNGDPNNGNLPRIDPVTGIGIITPESLKYKIRSYVAEHYPDAYHRLYIHDDYVLNTLDNEVFKDVFGIDGAAKAKELNKKVRSVCKGLSEEEINKKIEECVYSRFYDARTFGAVMTTMTKAKLRCSQTTGPVQFSMAQSIDPVRVEEIALTRCAVTDEDKAGEHTMGSRYVVPYGLYRFNIYVNPIFAKRTGFSEEDLNILIEALQHCYDETTTNGRSQVRVRKLIVMKHDSMYRSASSVVTEEAVHVEKKPDVEEASRFADYSVSIDTNKLKNIEVKEII